MQRMTLINRKAIDDLVHIGITDIYHIHHKCDGLTRKRMVGIHGKLAISNSADAEDHALALFILHLHLRTDTPEFRRDILDIISKSQIRVVRTEALGGIK